MELELWIVGLLCVVYFVAGFIDSIAGGGGLISLPCFLLTGLPSDVVMGTSRLSSSVGTSAALWSYARKGLVWWRAAAIGLPITLLGGFAGTRALLIFNSDTIGKIIVFLLPLGIIATLIPKNTFTEEREVSDKALKAWLPLTCLCIGFYEGFFGPGTGSFFILAFHYILGLGLLKASGTAKVFNLGASLSSLVVFIYYQKVIFLLAIPLALSNMIGGLMGSRMAIRIGAGFVRRILSVSLSILFATLVWKFFISPS